MYTVVRSDFCVGKQAAYLAYGHLKLSSYVGTEFISRVICIIDRVRSACEVVWSDRHVYS